MAITPDGMDVPLNCNVVNSRIITGSRPTDQFDVVSLWRKYTVSHIINVCLTDDQPYVKLSGLNIQYFWNPTADDGQDKPAEWTQNTLRYVMPLMAQAGWVFYIHCYDGINRGPSTAYAILRACGFTSDQAGLLIRLSRPLATVGVRYADTVDDAIAQGW